ncbi:hypothetical protein KGQ29_01155 [Patescibacteria group bacterium]|nr:hypothetical protein [Patescibacteria group bacterium]
MRGRKLKFRISHHKIVSEFFEPDERIASRLSAEATSLRNQIWWWCLLNKVRTYYEQNPDAD